MGRDRRPLRLRGAAVLVLGLAAACGGTERREPPETFLPGPFSGVRPGTATDGDPVPLALVGPYGAEVLRDERGRLAAPHRERFERAYRAVFSLDRSRRDYAEARRLFEALLAAGAAEPPVRRGLAHARLHLGAEIAPVLAGLEAAVREDPGYAAAHYDLAFLLAQRDRALGAEHFREALRGGVEDVRGLGRRFYGEP